MHPFTISYFMFFCFVFMQIVKGRKTFDSEYFFGYPKSRDVHGLSCDSQHVQLSCVRQCGVKFTCISGQCYCEDEGETSNQLSEILEKLQTYVNLHIGKVAQDKPKVYEQETTPDGFVDSTLRIGKPALRHHIAHFCPDLELARQCIRRCMEIGKPAFCGKDHVCYCGHKYSSTDKDMPLHIEDMYAQFRDLYEKYFGKNILDDDDDSNSNSNSEGD